MSALSELTRRFRQFGKIGEGTLGVETSVPRDRMFTEAQQAFRFYLVINGINAAFIADVERPSYRVRTQDVRLLNYKFNYPIEINWNPIRLTIKEVFSQDVFASIGKTVMNRIEGSVIDPPDNIGFAAIADMSKNSLVSALGDVKIVSITPDGESYEEWTLLGAMITDVKFSRLTYNSEQLTDISLEITYDWAKLKFNQNFQKSGQSQLLANMRK